MDHSAERTTTLRLHMAERNNPILPEGFGKVPITVNGKRYMATITKHVRDESGSATDLWLEADGAGPDGPVLLTLDELVTSHGRLVAAELEATREAR